MGAPLLQEGADGAYKTFVSKDGRDKRRLDVIEFVAVAEALGVKPSLILDALAEE